jgi:MoxR-like ATPase
VVIDTGNQADSRRLEELVPVAHRVSAAVETVISGKPEAIRLAMTVLLAEGHVLIEDVPGVGKTLLAKALARTIDCSVRRVQFTPDLLPGDLTGVSAFNQELREFEFKPGPIFANIVLGDEINRASPKTQSALLECMEERQVTVDGATYPLELPFMVIATQNPIEMEGTYPLPEAQRDRFTARISIGYPDRDAAATSARSSKRYEASTWRRRSGSTSSAWSPPRGRRRNCGSARRRGPRCTCCARAAPSPRSTAGTS